METTLSTEQVWVQFQWCVGYQVRREEGVNGISLIWRNILKSSNDLHYSNDKLFHTVTPKPFEKFQVKANSQDFLTPSEISQAQDRSQIHIMVTCAPLETEAMENNHRWHPAHLPHSSIKNCFKGKGRKYLAQNQERYQQWFLHVRICLISLLRESDVKDRHKVQYWWAACTLIYSELCAKRWNPLKWVFYRIVKLGKKMKTMPFF